MSPPTRLLLPTGDAAEVLGIKKTKLFELISRNELETVLLGRRRMVVSQSVSDYVQRLRDSAMKAA